VNWTSLTELLGPAAKDADEESCERREEAIHTALDAAGVPRVGSASARVYYLIHGRTLDQPGAAPVPGEPPLVAEQRKQAADAHEAWAAPMRRAWRARDDAEELYLRRASEMSSHQMLDAVGVPRGELSLNGRIAKALKLRYACAGPGSEETPPKVGKAKAGEVVGVARALLRRLPGGPWPVASSGLSLDVGDVRVRFEGGAREERLALARWFSMSRDVAEAVLGRTKR
jgi:hypothetical protein